VATKNKNKAMFYDELIKQLLMEMGELLEEVIVKCKKWHFKQIGKYINDLDVA
jgi:hypothetical protein